MKREEPLQKNIYLLRCNKCGYEKVILRNNITKKHGIDCPVCSEGKASKGEKIISQILQDNNIKFQREYIFSDCKNIFNLPFDFFC